MLHAWAANIRCDRYCSNFLDFGVQLNKASGLLDKVFQLDTFGD